VSIQKYLAAVQAGQLYAGMRSGFLDGSNGMLNGLFC
jgi:hypothetical protein